MQLRNWTHNFEDYKVAADNKGIGLFDPHIERVPLHYSNLIAFVEYLREHTILNWDLHDIQNAYNHFLQTADQ